MSFSDFAIVLFSTVLLMAAGCNVSATVPHFCKENGKCFAVVVDHRFTWEQAEDYCEKNFPNGRLASVHSGFDNNIFATWLPFLSTNPWIGAFRVGSLPFIWADGTDFDHYTNWAPNQPAHRCAQVCRSTTSSGNPCVEGKWTTNDCSIEAQSICEYGNLNEATTTAIPTTTTRRPTVPSCPYQWIYFSDTRACYRTFFNAVTWFDAEATCRSNGGHLTSIHSISENNFVAELASTHTTINDWRQQTFIGLIDLKHNRQWSWADGTSVNFVHWSLGEPNNGHNNEYCAEILSDYGLNDPRIKYRWNDFPCTSSMRAFVCKREPIWTHYRSFSNHTILFNITPLFNNAVHNATKDPS